MNKEFKKVKQRSLTEIEKQRKEKKIQQKYSKEDEEEKKIYFEDIKKINEKIKKEIMKESEKSIERKIETTLKTMIEKKKEIHYNKVPEGIDIKMLKETMECEDLSENPEITIEELWKLYYLTVFIDNNDEFLTYKKYKIQDTEKI